MSSAFLDVLQDFIREEKFTVTRIAGTSAGSVAACLLAADIQILYIKNMASRMMNDLHTYFPNLYRYSSALLKNVLLGNPLWDPEKLRSLLEQLFGQYQVATF
jgi:predicted acylesterase/phospholipase RssA